MPFLKDEQFFFHQGYLNGWECVDTTKPLEHPHINHYDSRMTNILCSKCGQNITSECYALHLSPGYIGKVNHEKKLAAEATKAIEDEAAGRASAPDTGDDDSRDTEAHTSEPKAAEMSYQPIRIGKFEKTVEGEDPKDHIVYFAKIDSRRSQIEYKVSSSPGLRSPYTIYQASELDSPDNIIMSNEEFQRLGLGA